MTLACVIYLKTNDVFPDPDDPPPIHMNGCFRLQPTPPTSRGAVKIVSKPPSPAIWAQFNVLGKPAMQTGWMTGVVLHKSGCSRENPGPRTSHKQVWSCDICNKQIHVWKQIFIWCNMIEHGVHLICAGIRQAQYTDTCTCHRHR